MKNNKKSYLVLLAFFLVFFMIYSGCKKETADKGNKKRVTISVSSWPRENQPDQRELYAQFQKIMLKKYNIEVIGDEYQYAVDSFLPKAASKSLPTMYETWFTETQKIIDNGFAADISSHLKKEGWDKEINQQLLPVISKNGKLYGVARDGYHQGLVCNVNLFKKAGLVDEDGIPLAPKTYEELIQTAKIIKEKTGAAGFIMETNNNCGGWHFMNIAWSHGVEFVKKNGKKWKATFNDSNGITALTYIKDLKWKYNVLPDNNLIDWSVGQEILATDQGAMLFFNGKFHGAFDFMINTYKIDKDNIAIFSMPAGPAGRYSQIGGNVWMFSPEATDEQIFAGLKWLEVSAQGPKLDEQTIMAEKASYKTDKAGGFMVGVDGLPAWASDKRMNLIKDLRKDYINVKPGMYEDYNNTSQVQLKQEVPVAAQD
ncbi:MAG: extracellular solute-binding protein, partial [Spirochaetes bacterium]|nr:extracellular solute-binding protein [Spirochaetota bacterium]